MNKSDISDVQKALGRRIGTLREEKGFTKPDLANRCGLPELEIKAIENGDLDLPLNTLMIVASALEVTVSALFHDVA